MSEVATVRWTNRPDLSSEAFWAAPVAERARMFADLREREPVAFFPEVGSFGIPPGPGYWALTRLDDCLQVSRDPHTFLSGPGYVIEDLPPQFYELFGVSLLKLDHPRHTRVRKIVSQGFTPRRMSALFDYVTGLSRQIVDDVIDNGECDAVAEIAARLPLRIICEMMGVPESQYEHVVIQTNKMVGYTDPEYADDPVTALIDSSVALTELMHDMAEHRRAHPGEDLTSALVNAEIDGETLAPEELAGFFNLLVVAGNETTRNAIAWGLHLLTHNPDQRAIWLADIDGVLPTAVEEIVRVSSPGIYMRRTLATDAVVGGQPMNAGEKVVMLYWAANRDPAHFTDPDTFDVLRSPNPHIGFGFGQHFCLGAHLARREIGVMFRELLTRVPDIHTTDEPVRLVSNFINGVKRLPVAFTPG